MFDGSAHTYDRATGRLSTGDFESSTYDVAALAGDGGRGRRDVREYPTVMLFAPTETALAETRKDRADFLYEAHLRIVQPFTPLVAALLGFAALQVGGYSRFGVWRQIGLAVTLIIAVQVAENAVADAARRDPGLWPLIYAPLAGALAVTVGLLWKAASPPLGRRRGRIPATAATAEPGAAIP
jgi:lipopolysaccharide export system permease protein